MSSRIATDEFVELYESNYHSIRNYCLRRLEPQDAEDAVSEVFAAAWRRFESMPAGLEPRLWLYGVARNTVNNFRRSARRRERLWSKVSSLRPRHSHLPEHHLNEVLIEALARLSERDQEIIRLRVWEDLSGGQVAAVLGISRPAANTRLHRAAKRMIAEVERLAGPDVFEEFR